MEEHLNLTDIVVIEFNRKLLLNTVNNLITNIEKQPFMIQEQLKSQYDYLNGLKNNIANARFGFETFWDNLRDFIKTYPEDLREYILMDTIQYFDNI